MLSEEMRKFRMMLDEKGIPWHDASEWDIVRTHADDGSFSVICGPYTYGGRSGLLEIMSNKIKKMHEDGEYDDDVIGCLTAEEVFEYIDNIDKKEHDAKFVVSFVYAPRQAVYYSYYFDTVCDAKRFAESKFSKTGYTFTKNTWLREDSINGYIIQDDDCWVCFNISKIDKWTGKEDQE